MIINVNVFAQTADFSGVWMIKERQMINGPEYSNALPKLITVIQNKDSLVIETINDGVDGQDVLTRQTLAMNEKQWFIRNDQNKRKYGSNLKWSADKKTLIITTVIYVPENDRDVDLTRIENWTFSSTGQLNINKKSIETRSENWEVRGIYDKQ